MKTDWKRNSFTLIELLVVIAVISILAGLLLPAMNTAREMGRKASCISRERQIGILQVNYTDSYKGFAPQLLIPDGLSYHWSTNWFWYALLGNSVGWENRNYDAAGYLYTRGSHVYRPSFSKDRRASSVFMCPSGAWETADGTAGNDTSYFYQLVGYQGVSSSDSRLIRVTSVKDPSRKVQLYESPCNKAEPSGSGIVLGTITGIAGKAALSDWLYGRHNRTVNLLFFDGHVENMASSEACRIYKTGDVPSNIFKYQY